MVLGKDRQINQCNRIEESDKIPHKYDQPIFDEGTKVIQWRKESRSTNEPLTLHIHRN